jgi:hypothetical protein
MERAHFLESRAAGSRGERCRKGERRPAARRGTGIDNILGSRAAPQSNLRHFAILAPTPGRRLDLLFRFFLRGKLLLHLCGNRLGNSQPHVCGAPLFQ